MEAVFARLERVVLMNVARVALFITMVLITADGLGRYLLKSPLQDAQVLVTDLLFPFIVFFSVSYVTKMGAHIRILFARQGLPRRVQAWLDTLFSALAALMWLAITVQAGIRSYDGFVLRESAVGVLSVPRGVSYGIVSVGSLATTLRLVFQTLHFWRGKGVVAGGH